MRIVVVGAGMAGLAAAQHLQQSGFAPLILEARDRIGGRTYTARHFAAHPVEFGAEFIHGSDAPT